ncbi:hypothetical protein BGZ76_004191 [Entomortierella beljakovae]|nr:hypothetical protein BGZ76_004191 [Entomortierella beljakovae]
MEHVKGGTVEKAFGVIHMCNHWGAIQVDFLNKVILFGGSLLSPQSAQQPLGSGSCAVNALNVIEHCENNAVLSDEECGEHVSLPYSLCSITKFSTMPVVEVNTDNSGFVGEIFSEIEVLHMRYLGESARFQMTMEMVRSLWNRSCIHDFGDENDISSDSSVDENEEERESESEPLSEYEASKFNLMLH